MKKEKRIAPRRDIDPIEVSSMTSLEMITPIARGGQLVNASTSGFGMRVHRTDFIPKYLRENLNMDALVGEKVLIFIQMMNLEIAGVITRAKHKGQGVFELALDYTEEAPLYWRECLVDLLPNPGELQSDELG